MKVVQLIGTDKYNMHQVGSIYPLLGELTVDGDDCFLVAIPDNADVYNILGELITGTSMLILKRYGKEL